MLRVAARRGLARTGAFDELHRCLKKWEILLVVGRIGAIDLYPFPGACDTSGLKWNDVVSRKLQFRGSRDRQPQSNPVAANASEHLVSDEVGVEAIDRSRTNTGQRKKQSVKPCLAAGLGCVDRQGMYLPLVI